MALDIRGLRMIASRVKGSRILCLGYPDITAESGEVKALLGVWPAKFTAHGLDHGIAHELPETVDTLLRAGAIAVDCVDVKVIRGPERVLDLNDRQAWPNEYELVINPGTVEHCFDIACAMFNAWRAVAVGGVALHVAPMTMLNHGFWNICPTALVDFSSANGGTIREMKGFDRDWHEVPVDRVKRFRTPPESILYALVEKTASVPETVPTQWRFG